jgi:predicted extracellular nuclease
VLHLVRCRSGNTLPAPTPVELPTAANKDAALERFEGMLVTINGPLTATNNFNLGVHRMCQLHSKPRCTVLMAHAL